MKPFDFLGDPNLPPHIAQMMQNVANNRASRGLVSADGQTHISKARKDIYDAGHGVLSFEYQNADRK